MPIDAGLANEAYCYVATTGRVTGNPHTIEIWFALRDSTTYILAGGRHTADWVKNAKKQPGVSVRIGAHTFGGVVRIVGAETDEDALARRMLLAKYGGGNDNLAEWGRTALAVAIDLSPHQ